MFDATRPGLPAHPGVGYKSRHFEALMTDPGPVGWIEIHAENYMGDGGRPLAQLQALAERFPVSVHGVGLSIGGEGPLDRDHLARLRRLCDRVAPASFSEHLAWSTHEHPDFLNDPASPAYTEATSGPRPRIHIFAGAGRAGPPHAARITPLDYLAFTRARSARPTFSPGFVRPHRLRLLWT